MIVDVHVHTRAPGSRYDPAEVEETIRAARACGIDRGGSCYLNPAHPPDFIQEEIMRCLVRGNLIGIKLLSAVLATDPRLDPILARAAELRKPLLHHAWHKAVDQDRDESTPAHIAHLARRHPGVTIIMAHLGGGGWRRSRAGRVRRLTTRRRARPFRLGLAGPRLLRPEGTRDGRPHHEGGAGAHPRRQRLPHLGNLPLNPTPCNT